MGRMNIGSRKIVRHFVLVDGGEQDEITVYNFKFAVLEEAVQSTTLVRPYLAKALLDWSPKKLGLVEGLDVYYAAWRASTA
jgi:hypothetical protein